MDTENKLEVTSGKAMYGWGWAWSYKLMGKRKTTRMYCTIQGT